MKRIAAVLAGLAIIAAMLCAFGQNADIKDKVVLFNNIEIPEGERVNGDIVAIFGNVAIKGDLTGDAVAIFGNMSVSGTVGGDAVAIFGEISVQGSGIIHGDAVGIMGEVSKSANAMIKGEIADISIPFSMKKPSSFIPRVSYGDMIGLFVIYAFSCLALLVVPERVRLMSEKSGLSFGRHLGLGFVIMLLFIPVSAVLSILLAITLIGIIFIPIIFIAFALAVFVGMVALEVAIGRRITGYLEGRNAIYIHLLVGVVLVYALRMVSIFGWLAYFVLITYAVGVAFDSRLGSPKIGKDATNV